MVELSPADPALSSSAVSLLEVVELVQTVHFADTRTSNSADFCSGSRFFANWRDRDASSKCPTALRINRRLPPSGVKTLSRPLGVCTFSARMASLFGPPAFSINVYGSSNSSFACSTSATCSWNFVWAARAEVGSDPTAVLLFCQALALTNNARTISR